MTVGLAIKKLPTETWEQCALRYARKHGLEFEVMAAYRDYIQQGDKPQDAAWSACVDWDIADLFDSAKGGWKE